MLALIPLFVSDEPHLASPDGLRAISMLCASLRQTQGVSRLAVVTDSENVFNFLETSRDDIILTNAPLRHHARGLPEDTLASVETLKEQGITPTTPFLCVNPRHPMLTSCSFSRALALFRKSGCSALVTAAPARDHPVQLNQSFRVKALGLVLLMEDSASTPPHCGRRLTRPFAFDWSNAANHHQQKGDGRFFIRTAHLAGYTFEEVRGLEQEADVVWERMLDTPQGAAARLWPLDELVAEGFSFDLCQRSAKTCKNCCGQPFARVRPLAGDDYELELDLSEAIDLGSEDLFNAGCRLRILPVDQGGGFSVAQDFPLPHAGAVHFRAEGRAANSATNRVSGFSYSILELVPSGSIDTQEPFSEGNNLWSYNVLTGECRNLETGELIAGRQDFPDVLTLKDAFAVLHPEALPKSSSSLEDMSPAVYTLDARESLRLDTQAHCGLCLRLLSEASRNA